MDSKFLFLANGTAAPFAAVPEYGFEQFRTAVLAKVTSGCRIMAFFAVPGGDEIKQLVAVLGDPEQHGFLVAQSRICGKFASLTAECPAFNRFEREIWENTGIVPEGHPWLKPLRFKHDDPGVTGYFGMKGDAVHEVAVGPVHAGVIEPGHFRFECMGEDVYSLEISLGYQHRGIENMLINGQISRIPHLLETAAGDTSIAAALNYAQIMEALSGVKPDESAVLLRQIALELERCANHIGDLGALAGDVAFLPTASFCGRIRGEYLNMTAELCGNRFGRNFIVPGGIRYEVTVVKQGRLLEWLLRVAPELWNALDLMFDAPTVLDRFENTGKVDKNTALALGLTGVAARASGLNVDARRDFPVAEVTAVPVKYAGHGDVFARAQVRYKELKNSHEFLLKKLAAMVGEIPAASRTALNAAPDQIAISVTEAWRGELCHVALTGADGKFRAYKIVDPSFHNWEGLAMALRGEQISNFPICNKSFNLSYCGHDL